jgi:hypothetical protein
MSFTPEQIKDVVNQLVNENVQQFSSIFEICMFISNVNKKLKELFCNENIAIGDIINNTTEIGTVVVDTLEVKSIITLDLASEYREILSNTVSIKESLAGFVDLNMTMGEAKENGKKILSNMLKSFVDNLLKE